MKPSVQKSLAWGLPVALLALGLAGAHFLSQAETVPGEKPPPALPLVEVVTLSPHDQRLDVAAQGTVRAAREVTLSFEVGGTVAFVDERLQDGAFLPADTVLARLDSQDYETRVVEAQAEVADAMLRLELEQAEADAAIAEWKEMQVSTEPPPLVARKPQVEQAKARVLAAKARLKAATRDVERCVVKMPFAGRVIRRAIERFQYAQIGTAVAELQATDKAEIALSIPDEELRFLSIPLDRDLGASGPTVDFHADFGGRRRKWTGRVVRTESGLDDRSRQVRLIAEIERPYAQNEDVPLLPGLYVDARIHGIDVESVFVVPRSALFEERAVLVVDDEDRLVIREIEILRKSRESVFVTDGLQDGERLCTTRLEVVVDGRKVRVAQAEPQPEDPGPQNEARPLKDEESR